MAIGHPLALIAAASLVLGGCASTPAPASHKHAHVYSNLSSCFGVNADFHFTAEKYERPWLPNSSKPFNFANLFEFKLRDDIERNVTHARLQLDGADSELRIIFSSSSNPLIFQSTLQESHVDCNEHRTVVKYMRSQHGADGFGGAELTITVTFKRGAGLVHATTRREGISRSSIFFMFPVRIEPTQTWAYFRQSR
jgi:hypothetical protein